MITTGLVEHPWMSPAALCLLVILGAALAWAALPLVRVGQVEEWNGVEQRWNA